MVDTRCHRLDFSVNDLPRETSWFAGFETEQRGCFKAFLDIKIRYCTSQMGRQMDSIQDLQLQFSWKFVGIQRVTSARELKLRMMAPHPGWKPPMAAHVTPRAMEPTVLGCFVLLIQLVTSSTYNQPGDPRSPASLRIQLQQAMQWWNSTHVFIIENHDFLVFLVFLFVDVKNCLITLWDCNHQPPGSVELGPQTHDQASRQGPRNG